MTPDLPNSYWPDTQTMSWQIPLGFEFGVFHF